MEQTKPQLSDHTHWQHCCARVRARAHTHTLSLSRRSTLESLWAQWSSSLARTTSPHSNSLQTHSFLINCLRRSTTSAGITGYSEAPAWVATSSHDHLNNTNSTLYKCPPHPPTIKSPLSKSLDPIKTELLLPIATEDQWFVGNPESYPHRTSLFKRNLLFENSFGQHARELHQTFNDQQIKLTPN